MHRMQRLCAACLLLCLVCTCAPRANGQTQGAQTYQQQLLGYYCFYQEEASREIEQCLTKLEQEDPQSGALWRQIMADWDSINRAGYDTRRALHDGLPQDDSLCIVVFGYGLENDGSMKPELVDRLQLALNAAKQYPNAFVAVTGGATTGVDGITEAGQMAAWLRGNGVGEQRLILETQALSTTENAVNTYALLAREYPQVRQVAAVTSDYHVAFAATMLQIVSDYAHSVQGSPEIPVAAGISCVTENAGQDMMASQAWGIGLVTDTEWNGVPPELLRVEPETTGETQTVTRETEWMGKSVIGRLLRWLFGGA